MRIATYDSGRGGWDPPPVGDGDPRRRLVLVFGDRPELLPDLLATVPGAAVLGCSTTGRIDGRRIAEGGLTAAVVTFDRARIVRAAAPLADRAAGFDAGTALAAELVAADPDLRAVLLLVAAPPGCASELIRGINGTLPAGIVVSGGVAATGSGDWVVQDGGARSGWATAVGVAGEAVRVGSGCRGGWDIFGPQRLVTRSVGEVLYELDGRPALDLYRLYLGEAADGLPATGLSFPLAIQPDPDSDTQLVRAIRSVDEETRSMTFAGDIPTGALAQLMRANFDRLVGGAEQAAQLTKAGEGDGPCLAVGFSDVGRRAVLGEGSLEEVEATLDFLPFGTVQVGGYGAGQIAPTGGGRCQLHNLTMSVTTLQENASATTVGSDGPAP